MAISLREVTEANFHECIRLKVRDDQPFVASNVYSIAESKISPHWIIRAICADEKMVGFLMYKLNYREEDLDLCRFMIDQEFQHMGYGKGALDLLKEIAMGDSGILKIGLRVSYGEKPLVFRRRL